MVAFLENFPFPFNTCVGQELWRTDGTPAGTFPVRDIAPGPASSDPQQLTAAGQSTTMPLLSKPGLIPQIAALT